MKYLFVLTAFGLLALACAGTGGRIGFSEGEKLFRSKCAACHRLPDPNRYAAEKWPAIIRSHSDRLKLNDEQITLLLSHLQKGREAEK